MTRKDWAYILFVDLFVMILVSTCYSGCPGYHVYGYIVGDENHTRYEDTIIYTNDWDDLDLYTSRANAFTPQYNYCWHYDRITRRTAPKTHRITVKNIKPKLEK